MNYGLWYDFRNPVQWQQPFDQFYNHALAQIREALSRLEDDPEEFGLCEECEEPIRPRRVELMPWVTLCVACQEKIERDGQVPGRRKSLTDYR